MGARDEIAASELATCECGRTTFWCQCSTPTTYQLDSIASFAAKIEAVAAPRCALWYEQ